MVKTDLKIRIAVGNNMYAGTEKKEKGIGTGKYNPLVNKTITWDEHLKELQDSIRITITWEDFKKATSEVRSRLKNVKCFLPRHCKDGIRTNEEFRSELVWDIDDSDDSIYEKLKYIEFESYIYSTASHNPEKPSLRLVAPFSREVNKKEFEYLTLYFLDFYELLKEVCNSSWVFGKLFFYPTHCYNVKPIKKHIEGYIIDVDGFLKDGWEDELEVLKQKIPSKAKAKTPPKNKEGKNKSENENSRNIKSNGKDKSGPIGAFCRSFTISQVLDKFLFEIYKKESNNVYTLISGRGTKGLKIYDNDELSYSWHDSDIAGGGQECDPYDLIWIHLFNKDHKEAVKWASTLEEVKQDKQYQQEQKEAKEKWKQEQNTPNKKLKDIVADYFKQENIDIQDISNDSLDFYCPLCDKETNNIYTIDFETLRITSKEANCKDVNHDKIWKKIKKDIEDLIKIERKKNKNKKIKNWKWDKKHTKYSLNDVVPLMSVSNLKILCKNENIDIKFNQLTKEIELNNERMEDRHDILLKDLTQIHKFQGNAIEVVRKYVDAISYEHRYHPVMDYLENLKPINSLNEFNKLCNTLTLQDTSLMEFNKLLIKKWLISGVAAIYNPTFKSQGVLTLQGAMGIQKSTWLRNLCPNKNWFLEELTGFCTKDKDSVKQATSYFMVELAELESTFKKDYIALKGFITRIYDEYRSAYAHRNEKHKRQTIFCASVNSPEFLNDENGNRRYWSLGIESINMKIKINMDILWAEIKNEFLKGTPYFLNSSETEELNKNNEVFNSKSTLDDIILEIIDFSGKKEKYLSTDLQPLIHHFFNMPMEKISSTMISKSLNKIGLKGKFDRKDGKAGRYRVFAIKEKYLKFNK